jgi:hypothetical protein
VIDRDTASRLARLPLGCLARAYPHKLDHVAGGDADVRVPRELHPAFYGCFDWHSAVHGYWTLARLARTVDDLPETPAILALFDDALSPDNLAVEAAYLARHPGFERTYGWAWLLALARELGGTRWGAAIEPLAEVIAGHYLAFLPKLAYPIRTGVHANTAFGLALAFDYARDVGHAPLERAIREFAIAYYGNDVAVPAAWEPSGEDFFSPSLMEADLARRVMPDFTEWMHRFLPDLPPSLREPARVTDRADGKLAHLDGLNLSRAWCMRAIAAALPSDDPLRDELARSAALHAGEGLAHVTTGDYMGEHWLATFAVYLLETPEP